MNQANTLLAGLMAGLLAGIAHSETAATESTHAAPEFKIMSDAEVQQHRERMAKLSEAAREAYRSAEYEKLKDRAEQEGYRLPDEPPWTEASSADSKAAGIQLTAAGTGEAPPPGLGPSEAYRATMKQRFERYLEERAERRADAAATRPPGGPPVPVDGHLAEQRESAAGQRAEQQTRMEERKAEMEARREGYRAEMQERNAQAEAPPKNARRNYSSCVPMPPNRHPTPIPKHARPRPMSLKTRATDGFPSSSSVCVRPTPPNGKNFATKPTNGSPGKRPNSRP